MPFVQVCRGHSFIPIAGRDDPGVGPAIGAVRDPGAAAVIVGGKEGAPRVRNLRNIGLSLWYTDHIWWCSCSIVTTDRCSTSPTRTTPTTWPRYRYDRPPHFKSRYHFWSSKQPSWRSDVHVLFFAIQRNSSREYNLQCYNTLIPREGREAVGQGRNLKPHCAICK